MEEFERVAFDALAGWNEEDHEAALAAFRHSAPYLLKKSPTQRENSADPSDLLRLAQKALALPENPGKEVARSFFEHNFEALRLRDRGLITGYYEPCFKGSRSRSDDFTVPLHKRPPDLEPINIEQARASGLSDETSFARKTGDGYQYHLSRQEVMQGGLDGQGLELVWLKDAIDAYIIHIQGSARIELDDGQAMRVAFDGKSGYPYRSIGKILIERGEFSRESITMDKLCDWLRDHGQDGLDLMAENPSYIFFKENIDCSASDPNLGPTAAASIPLIDKRSLAVDRTLHTFGLPIWLAMKLPEPGERESAFHQIVFAHDTGSAIKGLARGDLFCGSGQSAGHMAGQLQQDAEFTLLMPLREQKAEVRSDG